MNENYESTMAILIVLCHFFSLPLYVHLENLLVYIVSISV